MNEGQVMNAMMQAMAWIIGIGTAALGVLLVAVGRWIVGHIEGLRKTVSEEMRAFDVRISKLETIARMRRSDSVGTYGKFILGAVIKEAVAGGLAGGGLFWAGH